MRAKGIIMVLLTLALFGLAVASLLGLHFSLSTLNFDWGP